MPLTEEEQRELAELERQKTLADIDAEIEQLEAEKAGAPHAPVRRPGTLSSMGIGTVGAPAGSGWQSIKAANRLAAGAVFPPGASPVPEEEGTGLSIIKGLMRGTYGMSAAMNPIKRGQLIMDPQAMIETGTAAAIIGGALAPTYKAGMAYRASRSPVTTSLAPEAALDMPQATLAPTERAVAGVTGKEIRQETARLAVEAKEKQMFPWAFKESEWQRLEVERQGMMRRLRSEKLNKVQRGELAASAGKIEAEQREITNRVLRQTSPLPQGATRNAVRAAEGNQRPLKTYRTIAELDADLEARGPQAISEDALQLPVMDISAEMAKMGPRALDNLIRPGWIQRALVHIWGRPSKIMSQNEAGLEMVQHSVRTDGYRMAGEARNKLSLFRKAVELSGKETDMLVADNGQMYLKYGPYPTKGIRDFWEEWEVVAKEHKRWMESHGIPVQEGRYLPEVWTKDAQLAILAKNGRMWDDMLRYAHDNGKDLKGISREMWTGDPSAPSIPLADFSSFQLKRLGFPSRLPEAYGGHTIWDPDPMARISQYLEGVWRRRAVIEEFGKDASTVKKIWDRAKGNSILQHNIEKTWQVLQGIPQAPGFYESPWGQLLMFGEAVSRPIHLSAAGLANLTGHLFQPAAWGLKNTMRAEAEMLGSGVFRYAPLRLRKDLAANMMDFSGGVLKYTAETEAMGAPSGISRKIADVLSAPLKVTLQPVEGTLNEVASRAAVHSVFDCIKHLGSEKNTLVRRMWGESPKEIRNYLSDKFLFTEADVNRMVKNGMSSSDIARVMQRAPAIVNNFLEGAVDRPFWMRHPAGQRLTAYMAYVRLSGNLASDAVRAAKRGNFKPLISYMFYKEVSGEAENDLKNLLKNRINTYGWDEWEKRLTDNFIKSCTFAWFGAGYERWKYSRMEGPALKAVDMILPPQIDFYTDMWRAGKEIWGEATEIRPEVSDLLRIGEKHVRRIAPIADVAIGTGKRIAAPEAALQERKRRFMLQRKYSKDSFLP